MPVFIEIPCSAVVRLINVEDFLQFLFYSRIKNRGDGFHPFIKVPSHPVCGPDEKKGISRIFEAEDPPVLKKTAEGAVNPDGGGEVGNPGFQAAETSYVEEDRDPGLTGLIEFMDDLWILELVHFGPDSGGFSILCIFRFNPDQLGESLARVVGSRQQRALFFCRKR